MSFDQLLQRAGLWPMRVLWVSGPITAGPAIGLLLDQRPSTPALLVEIGAWLLWFLVLLAVLVPSPRSLTALRILAPVALAVSGLSAALYGWDDTTIGAVGWAAVTTSVAFMPIVADHMVNGSAYGSERRMALRPPGFALLGPIQLAWLVVLASILGPATLLLHERYVATAAAVVVGAGASWAAVRVLHQLSERWVVFVPAGFVLRDPMTLLDAVLCRRNLVAVVGPALAIDGSQQNVDNGPRADLSGGSRGLALEVALKEATPISVREGRNAAHREVTNLVFTPSLPGAMLREARIRGLKIGSPESQTTG